MPDTQITHTIHRRMPPNSSYARGYSLSQDVLSIAAVLQGSKKTWGRIQR